MNNYNLSELSDSFHSDADETANNSFRDKETKELIYAYNNALYKIKDDMESFKKSQNIQNAHIKQENKTFKQELKILKNKLINLLPVKQSCENKTILIEKDINMEKEEMNSGLVHNPESLNEYFVTISNFLQKVENENLNPKMNREIKNKFSKVKKDLTQLYKQKDDIIEMLLKSNKKMEEGNTMLNDRLLIYEEENNRMQFCIHCHLNFSKKNRDDQLCIYHPGELKYYSCRGCGGDEYYTCCLKCTKCSPGCRKSKHVSEC